MASPQREDGHLDVANELAEALARTRLNSTQSCILWVILRKTYGWQKKMDTISLSHFAEATGIHRTQVARELGRLAARRIIIEWGDDHHPKQYGIQKDYTRWVMDEKVSTETLTPRRKVSTDPFQSVNGSATKVSTESLTTITKKDTLQKQESTEPHGSGTLRARFAQEWRDTPNKGTVAGKYFQLLLGQKPDIGRLGGMWGKRRLNSGGKLFDLMLEASRADITDDPHDYLDKLVTREMAKETGHAVNQGRARQGGREASHRDRRRSVGAAGSHGAGGYDSWTDED